jgi:transcriptional regulator with XRE-family HTH domain
MEEFTYKELKKAREAAHVTQWQAANACGVSEDLIKRWERGDSKPTPEDVDNLCELYGDPTIWHRWMCSNHDSYRKRYIAVESYSLPAAIMRSRYEIQDVVKMQEAVERDAMTGRIDDPELRTKYRKELEEMVASARDVLDRL